MWGNRVRAFLFCDLVRGVPFLSHVPLACVQVEVEKGVHVPVFPSPFHAPGVGNPICVHLAQTPSGAAGCLYVVSYCGHVIPCVGQILHAFFVVIPEKHF